MVNFVLFYLILSNYFQVEHWPDVISPQWKCEKVKYQLTIAHMVRWQLHVASLRNQNKEEVVKNRKRHSLTLIKHYPAKKLNNVKPKSNGILTSKHKKIKLFVQCVAATYLQLHNSLENEFSFALKPSDKILFAILCNILIKSDRTRREKKKNDQEQ